MEKRNQLIVVKAGTTSLTGPDGAMDTEKVAALVAQVCGLKRAGHNVVVVTSGAIAAGFRRLGYAERPKTVPAKQASAAVGQGLLIEEYIRGFYERGYIAAQLLITRADFTDRRRYRNAYNTLSVLLKKGAVPVINENDTVSIEELRFGDNDMLSAQVASLLHADLLVILTDVDGLYTADPQTDKNAKLIERVAHIDEKLEAAATSGGSRVGTGGMASKVAAAKVATASGVPVLVCASAQPNVLQKAAAGTARGSWFDAVPKALGTRLQWLAFHSDIKGQLVVDDGAVEALGRRHTSLLPSGVVEVRGDFEKGDVVEVTDRQGSYVGRGMAGYAAAELRAVMGMSSAQIEKNAGHKAAEAIHRDNWLGADKMNKEAGHE